MALWPAHSIEAFCHNDGGRPLSDSSLSFPMASNHLRFAAPLSLHEEGKELWSSTVNTHSSRKHSDHTTARARRAHTHTDGLTNITQTFPPPLLWLFEAHLLSPNEKAAGSANHPSFLLSLLNTHTRTGTSPHLPPTLYWHEKILHSQRAKTAAPKSSTQQWAERI